MQVPKRKSEKYTNIAVDPHMTQEKFMDLKNNLDRMLKARPLLAKDVQFYAANGDFSENAEYQIAKGKLRGLNRRIDETKDLINKADIIKPTTKFDTVQLGSTVTIEIEGPADSAGKKEKTYKILGSSETRPEQGIVSHQSPIGAALMGKRVNEEVLVKTKNREIKYRVISIE